MQMELEALAEAGLGSSQAAQLRRTLSTPAQDHSANILACAHRLMLAETPREPRDARVDALAGRLQPHLRRAMRVVAHPDAFMDGYFPEELQSGGAGAAPKGKKKGKKARRRRKRRAAPARGVAGLEHRAADDAALYEAMSEFKWSASIAAHAMTTLVPKQRVRASTIPAEAVGYVGRAQVGEAD